MVQLTPVGKATIAIIALLAAYFLILPLFLGLLFPGDGISRTREIKIMAFLKTFDKDSASLQHTLRQIEQDQNLQHYTEIELINVDAEPGKMEQNNVSSNEVPCFILGNQKFTGAMGEVWFRQKIAQLREPEK